MSNVQRHLLPFSVIITVLIGVFFLCLIGLVSCKSQKRLHETDQTFSDSVICKRCKGKGFIPFCPRCGGTGRVLFNPKAGIDVSVLGICPQCYGLELLMEQPITCPKCHGKGKVLVNEDYF